MDPSTVTEQRPVGSAGAPISEFHATSTSRARILAAHALANRTGHDTVRGLDLWPLYVRLAAGGDQGRRHPAVRSRATTLAGAYLNRFTPTGAAPEGVLVGDDDTGGVTLAALDAVGLYGHILGIVWAGDHGRIVDILSGAEHARGARQAARTGSARRCIASAEVGLLGQNPSVRLITPAVPPGVTTLIAQAELAVPSGVDAVAAARRAADAAFETRKLDAAVAAAAAARRERVA